MRQALAVACGFAVVGIAATSCLVNRKTADFECAETADCTAGRLCTSGFCITDNRPPDSMQPDVTPCPSPCTSCDFGLMTCDVVCNTANGCSDITCPAGFACEVDCTASNACDDVDCSLATSCDVECDGVSACETVTCGTGPCDVTCSGNSACDVVDCASSCECDVVCVNNADCLATCPPPSAGGGDCTDGTPNGCDSNMTNCDSCP